MSSENPSKLALLVSLGLAAASVFSSYLFPNTDSSRTLTLVLIAVWLIPFSYLVKEKNASTRPFNNSQSKKDKEQL